MEIWIIALIFIIAAFGILAMLGYVKNETDRLQLKHFLATAEFKREIEELQKQHSFKVESDRLIIDELTAQVAELEASVGELEAEKTKLQTSLDKLRLDVVAEDLSTTTIAS